MCPSWPRGSTCRTPAPPSTLPIGRASPISPAALLTRGTGKRTASEIDTAIEFVGGRLEAGADRDGLVAAVDVLRKDLSLGLDLLSEVLLTPAFPAAELTRKVTEIEAAIQRAEESPEGVAGRALRRLVFAPHPYAWPVEGTRESVAKLTRADVVGFYQGHVRPDATVVALVGAITRGRGSARGGGPLRAVGPAGDEGARR